MPGMFGRRTALIGTLVSMLIAAQPGRAETVNISIDAAYTMKMPERVSTIVIGNPLIADATLQSGGILVLTGKGFGSTNMLALDRAGKTVMNTTIQVLGPASPDLVVVYKGIERESYSCAPECERRLTLGDSPAYFSSILAQAGTRMGGGGGGGGAPAPAR